MQINASNMMDFLNLTTPSNTVQVEKQEITPDNTVLNSQETAIKPLQVEMDFKEETKTVIEQVKISGKPVQMVYPLKLHGEVNKLPVSTCIDAMRGYGRCHTTRTFEPYKAYGFNKGDIAIAYSGDLKVAFRVGDQYKITPEMITDLEYQDQWSQMEKHSSTELNSFIGKSIVWGLHLEPLGDYVDGEIKSFPVVKPTQLTKNQIEALDKFEEILDQSTLKIKQGITPQIEKNLTQFNARSIVEIHENKIVIDESKLDLFSYFDQELKPWKPSINLPPYSSLTQLQLDIETTGLDPTTCRVVLIGLMNEKGTPVIIDCLNDEKKGLLQFLEVLNKKKPNLLNTFNGFKFDLPFLIERMRVHKIKHPFVVNMKREKCFKVAQMFGQPAIYNDIYLKIDGKDVTLIDLFHQVLAWDFVARKLTARSLKQSVLQMGLRKEARLELSYEEMMEHINSGDITKLKEYLVFDLEDTKLLADNLIPNIWYQKLFLPDWKLQSVSTSGNGSKWNDVLKKIYPRNLPDTSDKKSFQGGLTGANSGYFPNVSKIDVASLYPSIMLTYGICSHKDKENIQLSILKYLLDFRLNLKAKKKDGTATQEEKRTEGAYKVIINSGYGCLGTQGIEFNDYVAAALVTAYGRGILKLMIKTIEDNGGAIASCDTDGVYYSTDDTTFTKNKEIHRLTQAAMPKGINLDYELEAAALFVPPRLKKGKKVDNEGLKKNYIIVTKEGKTKCKGRFVKRDVCKFQKEFQPNIIRLLTESKDKAESHYKDILNQMQIGIFPVSDLMITRKIRKGEKTLVDLGVGKEGEQVSFYKGIDQTYDRGLGKTGKPLKAGVRQVWTKDGQVDWNYYIKLLNEMWQEVLDCLEFRQNELESHLLDDAETHVVESFIDSSDFVG